MSPSSIGSYAQADEAAPPPKREEGQSVKEKSEEEEKAAGLKSAAGEGRGGKIDIDA